MELYLRDKNFLDNVETFSGRQLQYKADLQKIIEAVINGKKEQEFEKLIFTAKYISGMFRVLKNAPAIPEVKSIEHIRSDLKENIQKGTEQLRSIISESSGMEKQYFEQTYFKLTAQNFKNLSQLFSDLESVKKYFNYLNRQG